MNYLLIIILALLTCPSVFGQKYKELKSKKKHSDKIISIANTNDFFATSSYDKSIIVWNYEGKIIYKYRLNEGKINTLTFVPDSNFLLVGVTEMANENVPRYVIKCLDLSGEIKYALIDTTLTQEIIGEYYKEHTTGVQTAINDVANTFPSLNTAKGVNTPQVNTELSHIELVQSIAVSPDSKTIVSIDKFNILKVWERNGAILNSFQIHNNKKNTELYFLSDSTILITPSILLNINSFYFQNIEGFREYASIPVGNMIYFHYDYNTESRPEKLYNLMTANVKEFDPKHFYTLEGSPSIDRVALLGVDGLIRVINKDGELLSTFGKSKNEVISFRGEKVRSYSEICEVGFSPNGKYLVSGEEDGKIKIWKDEE